MKFKAPEYQETIGFYANQRLDQEQLLSPDVLHRANIRQLEANRAKGYITDQAQITDNATDPIQTQTTEGQDGLLLIGHTPEQLEQELHQMVESVIATINLCLQADIDTIIALDKSSRPWGFLLQRVFQHYLRRTDIDNSDVQFPKIIFRNIGRENRYKEADFGVRVDSARSFEQGLSDYAYETHVDAAADTTQIDIEPLNVLVIDDIAHSNATLIKTHQLFNDPDLHLLRKAKVLYATLGEGPWHVTIDAITSKHRLGVTDSWKKSWGSVGLDPAKAQERAKYQYGYVTKRLPFAKPTEDGEITQEQYEMIELRKILDYLAKQIALNITLETERPTRAINTINPQSLNVRSL